MPIQDSIDARDMVGVAMSQDDGVDIGEAEPRRRNASFQAREAVRLVEAGVDQDQTVGIDDQPRVGGGWPSLAAVLEKMEIVAYSRRRVHAGSSRNLCKTAPSDPRRRSVSIERPLRVGSGHIHRLLKMSVLEGRPEEKQAMTALPEERTTLVVY